MKQSLLEWRSLEMKCIESRDIVTWFRWFRCGKCCLKDKFTFLMPYFNLIWSCPLQVGWGGKFSRRQWVVSCGCATTPDRDLLLHACALCAMGTVRWSFRGSEKTSGLVIFHVFGPSSYIIIQCRGESCENHAEPCWMIDNLKFSKVMIIFTIVSSTVAERPAKLPLLESPKTAAARLEKFNKKPWRPKTQRSCAEYFGHNLVKFLFEIFLSLCSKCWSSSHAGVHSFLFLVIALDPRS